MGRRTKQSNSREMCPICRRILTNRAAATSHYRSHVKRGEITESESRYFRSTLKSGEIVAWRRGFQVTSDNKPYNIFNWRKRAIEAHRRYR